MKIISVLLFSFLVIAFFWQFFIKGLLPIPADNVIGLYHPFRDLFAKDYSNGIPYKNFLLTDPVRQQYPWRELTISLEKKFQLPLWNPYSLSGTPLLANFQSAFFYPFNLLFFLMPFALAWSLIIFLGPLLGGVFLFLYLDNLRLSKWASILGVITFSFSGFFVAWMEWGTITHVALWFPLILLAIDKFFSNIQSFNSKFKIQNSKLQLKIKNYLWPIIFVFSLTSAFFAGHLQTFFYLFVFSWIYFFSRWWQYGRKINVLVLYFILYTLYLILTAVQWAPTLQLILLSARNIDQVGFNNPGWFIPWQHLVQFIAPDFFGNPTTLNYWGVWNYGEFIGYVGTAPLVLAIFAMFFRHDRKTIFFGSIFFISIIFAFPTFLAKLPYILQIPFISTSQPTRLIFIIDFSLAILAAFGFDYFIRTRRKEIAYPLIFISLIFLGLWGFVVVGNEIIRAVLIENVLIAKRNLIFPTLIFTVSAALLLGLIRFSKSHKNLVIVICTIIVVVTGFDLLRFGLKFTPFTKKEYLFPSTKTISFLQKNIGEFRIMSTDSRIFPPNFSTIYRIQSVDGYDPLFLQRYGELIAASERGKANIDPPFGFNRIITPHNYDSKIIDLLGVKYILSLSDLDSAKLKKVFQEGETRIYQNMKIIPRAFFVDGLVQYSNKHEVIKRMFDQDFDFRRLAVVESVQGGISIPPLRWKIGEAEIARYSENKIVISTKNTGDGFLVLTDSYYPIWHARIDGIETKIYRTDYNFRGVIVPEGKHIVEFYNSLI